MLYSIELRTRKEGQTFWYLAHHKESLHTPLERRAMLILSVYRSRPLSRAFDYASTSSGPGGNRTPMQPIILSTHYECEGIQVLKSSIVKVSNFIFFISCALIIAKLSTTDHLAISRGRSNPLTSTKILISGK